MDTRIDIVDSLITPPDALPVSIEFVRDHVRAIDHSEDHLLELWIQAATQYFEAYTGRQVGLATREALFETWPGAMITTPWRVPRIELPRPPLQDVVSITYMNSAGATVPFSDGASPETVYWTVEAPTGTYARPGWVSPVSGYTWPTGGTGLRIRYLAGYGATEAEIPELVRGTICMLVSHFDRHRGDDDDRASADLPKPLHALLEQFKYASLPSTRPRVNSLEWGV
jgi:phage conserved hypothetical protein, phiE125 gp8 family